MSNNERKIFKNRYLYLLIACLYCGLLSVFTAWKNEITFPNQMLFIVGFIISFVIYFKNFKDNNTVTERDFIFLIIAIGFIFRVVYIESTGHRIRQHDVGGNNGHLAYIESLYNGEGLPQSDVTKLWQYYQPPFWHMLCAAWLKVQTFIGVAYNSALENLQLISLFFSSAVMLLSHKLFRLFEMKGGALIIAVSIVAFHPTFIILSGSINNDVMSLALALLSVILTIKWFRNPKFSTIIALAFSLGISMGVKVSGGLISLGIAVLFAIRLFGKEIKNKGKLIGQFATFGVICVPLALWYQVRNFIMFDVPITYVPKLSEKSSQYIGFRSVFERLFDFSSLSTNGVYPARIGKGFDVYEYNIPLGALKSSVFGEYYLGKDTGLEYFSVILFYSAAILAVLSVICAVFVLIKAIHNRINDAELTVTEHLFPIICGLTQTVSYLKFCFDYAHFCTMDFRYIAMTVVFGALYIGLFIKNAKENNKMFGNIVMALFGTLTVLMSVSSFAIYGMIS